MTEGTVIAGVGDTHGNMAEAYEAIDRLETLVGERVSLVLQVGDMGEVPARVPRQTVFIGGNAPGVHDQFGTSSCIVKKRLLYLAPGHVHVAGRELGGLRIGGIGGSYSPVSFHQGIEQDTRHYSRKHCESLRACGRDGVDILLSHDAPEGLVQSCALGAPPRLQVNSQTEGLLHLISELRPTLALNGHLHMPSKRLIAGCPSVGLSVYPSPGSIVLFRVHESRAEALIALGQDELQANSISPAVGREEIESDDAVIAGLDEALKRWKQDCLRNAGASVIEMRKVAGRLKGREWANVLIAALNTDDIVGAVRMFIPIHQRSAVLEEWNRTPLAPLDAVGTD